jgi:ribosome-associated protein
MAASLPTPSRDDETLVVRPGLEIPASEFEFTFMRSSGPGGQNVNKVSTKARLRWPVAETQSLPEAVKERFTKRYHRRLTNEGELILTSQRYRDQAKNVGDCLLKLREMIDAIVDVPKPRKKTKPTRGSKERRLKEKRGRAQRKDMRKPPKFSD